MFTRALRRDKAVALCSCKENMHQCGPDLNLLVLWRVKT